MAQLLIVKACADDTTIAYNSVYEITRMMNSIPSVTVTVHDFEGTKYTEYMDDAESVLWKDAQFQPIKIFNDAETECYFVGRIHNVEFQSKAIILSCVGASARLNDLTYTKNYVYAEGYVDKVNDGSDPDKLVLVDTEGDAFTWADDYWSAEKNNAVLVTDSTAALYTTTWVASGVTLSGCSTTSGAYTDTVSKNNVSHSVKASASDANKPSGSIIYTLTGDAVADSFIVTRLLFVIKLAAYSNKYPGTASLVFQILKEGSYVTLFTLAVPDGVNFEQTYIFATGNTELIKYLTKSGTDYISTQVKILISSNMRGIQDPINGISWVSVSTDCVALQIEHQSYAFSPIQKRITDSGASYIIADDADFFGNGVTGASGSVLGDKFQIGENTQTVLVEATADLGVTVDIDTTFDKYIARNLIGVRRIDLIEDIMNLEDAYWFEQYSAAGVATIVMRKRTNFGSSVVTVNANDCEREPVLELPGNQYKAVRVWGNQYYDANGYAIDTNAGNTSPQEYTVIDQTMNTSQDCQTLAEALLARFKDRRPSYVVTFHGSAYTGLQPGQNITLNLVRPTITSETLPIRRLDLTQVKNSALTQITLYLGLGNSPPSETLGRTIKKSLTMGQRNQTNMLTPGASGVPIVSHRNLTNLFGSTDQYHISSAQWNSGNLNAAQLEGHAASYFATDSAFDTFVTDVQTNGNLYQPKINTVRTTDTALTTATYYQVAFEALVDSVQSRITWSAGTTPSRIIIQEAGFYQINATAYFGGNSSGRRIVRIFKNGSSLGNRGVTDVDAAATEMEIEANVAVQLAVNDYIEMAVYATFSSGTLNLNQGTLSMFRGSL